jgi:hypothetical protein
MDKQDFKSQYDRQSLLNVRNDYDNMKILIGSLSSKLTTVSSQIEKEFLSAYRVHMLSVQEELRNLKSQVVDAEFALNDDDEVSRLETEVTWFSDEATRLRNQSNSMRKDMQHVVSRIDGLREQRQYLNEQLKTTLKRTRILEAEMGILSQQHSQMLHDEEADSYASYGMTNQQNDFERYNSNEHAAESSKQSSAVLPSRANSLSALPKINKKMKPVAPEDPMISKKKSVKDLDSNKSNAIEELKQLEDSRLDVELDLESVIRSVFSEIIDRKVNSHGRVVSKKDPNSSDSQWDIKASTGGLTGLGISHFSDTDRLSVIATFLGMPHNFQKVFETLSDELEFS